MKTPKNLISTINNRQGVTAILVSLTMLTLIFFAALAVDIGYILTTKNELQNIADAAALAAARKLGGIYVDRYSLLGYLDYEPDDRTDVVAVVIAVAGSNRVGGKNGIIIKDGDIKIGIWDGNSFDPPGLQLPHATKITAWMDNTTTNGSITTFFAKLFGINSVEIQATAIAAMSGYVREPGDGNQVVNDQRGECIFPLQTGAFMGMGSIPSLVK